MKIKSKNRDISIFITCFLFMLLIFLRDVEGVSVNKFLFIIITAVALLAFDTRKTIIFFSFLLPLFNGIPGNYICLLILLKLVFSLKNQSLGIYSIFYALIVFCYEFMHIVELSSILQYCFWGMNIALLLVVLLQEKDSFDLQGMLIAFSVAFVFCGTVMLICVEEMGYLEDVISGRYRFGDFSEISLNYTRSMRLTIDPNYLGLFSLSSIMGLYMLLQKFGNNKFLYVLLMVVSTIWGFLTLSRTFFILLVVFMIMQIMFYKSTIKQKLISMMLLCISATVVIFATNQAFPDLFDSMFGRLSDSDFETAGGRSSLNTEYINLLFEDFKVFLFGTGCIEMVKFGNFSNDLHCTWLQFPVGFGLIGLAIIIFGAFVLHSILKSKSTNESKINRRGFLTFFIIQLGYYAFLPSLENPSQLFPLLLGLTLYYKDYDYEEDKNDSRA